MKIERTKNATRNIVTGTILKIYQTILPFIIRTVMIYWLGVEYLGLNSLFSSILQVLNLAELGVGSAMVYSMYKPIVEDDTKTICALMKLYRTYYRIIGLVVALAGGIITPFVPKLIKGGVPTDLNVYILYLMNLAATVLTYWLFAYKNSILLAYQRNDKINNVTILTTTVQYGGQLLVLYLFRNYYYFLLVLIISQILNNVLTAFVADQMFPEYKPVGDLPKTTVKEINQRIRDLFTSKVGTVILGAADTIVISAFLGLKVLAVYQNYYYILSAIYSFVGIILASIMAGMGNSFVTDSKEKTYKDFNTFNFIIEWIVSICCCCMLIIYQPFMKIWVGEELMLENSYVALFCALYYVLEMCMAWATVKDAAGLWHSDRFRPLIGALTNLGLNIILVQFIGLYGIILSTIISDAIICMPWLIHNMFKLLYKRSAKLFVIKLIFNIFVMVMSCLLCFLISNKLTVDGITGLILRILIGIGIPCVVETLVYYKTEDFKNSVRLVKRMIGR